MNHDEMPVFGWIRTKENSGYLKYERWGYQLRCDYMTLSKNPIRDERGGPLVEESLLLGLAVVTISIVIAVIFQATGWAQNVVAGLIQLLEDSWNGLTQFLP
jgi:hypothetical protein